MEKRSVGQDLHSQYPQGTDWQGQGSQEVDWQGVGLQGQNREGGRTYYTGLSSIKEGDNVRYYLYNHRGDTVLVTGGDGEIIHNLSYEAYGKATDKLGYPLNTSTNDISFASKGAEGVITDPKTGLQLIPEIGWYAADKIYFLASKPANYLGRFLNYFDPVHSIEARKTVFWISHTHTISNEASSNITIQRRIYEVGYKEYADTYNKPRINAGGYFAEPEWEKFTSIRENCWGYAIGGGQGVFLSDTNALKILSSDSYTILQDDDKKYSNLQEGDVIQWGGHVAVVFVVNGDNIWIIEKDGHSPVYFVPLVNGSHPTYGSNFENVYRPTSIPLVIQRESGKISRVFPFALIKKEFEPEYNELKKHGTLSNFNRNNPGLYDPCKDNSNGLFIQLIYYILNIAVGR